MRIACRLSALFFRGPRWLMLVVGIILYVLLVIFIAHELHNWLYFLDLGKYQMAATVLIFVASAVMAGFLVIRRGSFEEWNDRIHQVRIAGLVVGILIALAFLGDAEWKLFVFGAIGLGGLIGLLLWLRNR